MSHIEQLGDAAIGTIGPGPRIAAGEISEAKVDELAKRLQAGEFYVDASEELGPNSAGGTFSLVVADALTTNRFRAPGQTAQQHATALYKWLMEHHNTPAGRLIIPRVCVDGRLPVPGSVPNPDVIGGHDDEHGPGGCGAQSKLEPILKYIHERGETVRAFAATHGVEVDAETHQFIVANAGALLAGGYVSSGPDLRAAYVETAGAASVTTLAGEHQEVVGALNMDPAKRLDRSKIREVFGEGYDAFGIDAGVFPAAAAAISEGNAKEAYQKFIALVYFNVATTTVLSDPSLRITVPPAS